MVQHASKSAIFFACYPAVKEFIRTSVGVDFVQSVLVGRQHAHVRAELFHQDIYHFLGGGSARHTDTFGHHIGAVLEVESDHSMELTIL